MYRKLYFMGILAYAFMFLLSLVFYKERILFLDASFVLFHMIKEGTFCIQVWRFGDALMQLPPFLAFKAGLPLHVIIRCFSASPVLICFSAYALCGSALKQYKLAVVILLLQVLLTADTFYWPISQIPQGMAILILTFGLAYGRQAEQIGTSRWVLILCSVLFLAFFHPLMTVVMAYTVLFFTIRKDISLNKWLLFRLSGLFLLFFLMKMVFFNSSYDRHSMSGLKNFVKLFPHYFTLYSDRQFLQSCLTKYYWIPLLFIGVIAHYLQTKQWNKLMFFIICVPSYLLLVNISYPDASTPGFYIENLYLPLALFLALPFVFDLLPVLIHKRLALPVVGLMILTGCIRMYAVHTAYTARLNWERSFLAAYGDKKMVVSTQKINLPLLQMVWGTAYEFALLSACEQGHTASIVIDADPGKFSGAAMQRNALAVTWDLFPYSTLNPAYFHFTDTTTTYLINPPVDSRYK